jgi:hypothetical protein
MIILTLEKKHFGQVFMIKMFDFITGIENLKKLTQRLFLKINKRNFKTFYLE